MRHQAGAILALAVRHGLSAYDAAYLELALTAGVDTTIAALGHTLHCLAQDPAQYAELRANPALVRGAFE